jgi:hypothetical protein
MAKIERTTEVKEELITKYVKERFKLPDLSNKELKENKRK